LAELMTALPKPLFSVLQREKFLLPSTLDYETGAPSVRAISCVYMKDPATICLAIDQRSIFLIDMKNNPTAEKLEGQVFESPKKPEQQLLLGFLLLFKVPTD
jgi:hypothetical protein